MREEEDPSIGSHWGLIPRSFSHSLLTTIFFWLQGDFVNIITAHMHLEITEKLWSIAAKLQGMPASRLIHSSYGSGAVTLHYAAIVLTAQLCSLKLILFFRCISLRWWPTFLNALMYYTSPLSMLINSLFLQ